MFKKPHGILLRGFHDILPLKCERVMRNEGGDLNKLTVVGAEPNLRVMRMCGH